MLRSALFQGVISQLGQQHSAWVLWCLSWGRDRATRSWPSFLPLLPSFPPAGLQQQGDGNRWHFSVLRSPGHGAQTPWPR